MDEVRKIILQAQQAEKTNWIRASQILLDGMRKHPRSPSLRNELGSIYFRRELFRKASLMFEEALYLGNGQADIIFKLGYCFLAQKEYEKAITYFDMIAAIIPEAAYNKCIALYQIDEKYQAIGCLEEIVSGECYSEKPFLLLARIYLDFERYEKSIAVLDEAEKRYGYLDELHYLRGFSHFRLKRWLAAYIDFQLSESFGEPYPIHYRMYALTSEKIGKTDKAIGLLKQCIEKYPDFYASYYDLINIYMHYDRYQDAMTVIRLLEKHGLSLDDKTKFEGVFFNKVFREIRGSGYW